MGIERFFKSINSLYSNKFIKPIYKNDSITHLYFDFNSVIHKVSNNIVNDINNLLLYSLIYKYCGQSGMNEDIVIEEFNSIHKLYNFEWKIENFYQNIAKINLNNLIYHHIFKDIRYYLSFYPNCKFLYIGIDGVPSVGKMIEQQDRRYKGYLMSLINKQVLLKHKNQLDNKEFDMSNIYNEYEYLSMKISFDKNLISPQTDFMTDFINLLKKENFKSGMDVEISDFSEKGEGEKKIVIHIKKYCSQSDQIIIYSPDADMIIMTMILKYNIFILRHEQTTSEDAIIEIDAIKKEFTPVDDIAYIFSVFGDDFIPKIDWINVTKHIPRILEEYRKMGIRIIDDKTNKVNLLNLQKFFKQIKKLEGTMKLSKNRFDDLLKPVNYKSFKYYNELNDLNNLTRNYEPTFDTAENTIPALDYYKAMLWKYNYYFLDDDSNNDFYYSYHGAPTIDTLINFKEFDKVRLEEYKTTDIMPIDQLCFISPINVSQYVEKQKINKELANKLYKIMKIKLPEIKVDSKGDVNVNEIFNCHNARYLNKCYVRFDIIKFQDFKKLIGSPSEAQMGRLKRVVEKDQNYEYIIDEIYNYKYEYLEEIDKFLTNNCFDTQRYSLNELKVRYSTDNIQLMIMNENNNVVYACLLWISGNNIYLSSICVSNDKRSQGIFKKAMIFLAKYYSKSQNNIIFNLHADKERTNNLNQKKRIEIYSHVGFYINENTIVELENNKKAQIIRKIIDDKDFRYYINDENQNKYIIDSNQIDICLTRNINYIGYKVGDKYEMFRNLINYSCPMTTTPELILKFNSV
jgi:hypothetical protein